MEKNYWKIATILLLGLDFLFIGYALSVFYDSDIGAKANEPYSEEACMVTCRDVFGVPSFSFEDSTCACYTVDDILMFYHDPVLSNS